MREAESRDDPGDVGRGDEPDGAYRDPRLEIPKILREPVKPPPDPDKKPAITEGVQAGRAWAIGMEFVFTIVAAALLGWFYDRWRGTAPTGAGIGLGVGFIFAFYRIVSASRKEEEAERRQRERK